MKYLIILTILITVVFIGFLHKSAVQGQTSGIETIYIPTKTSLTTAETTLKDKIVVLQKKTITLAEWKNIAPKLLEKTISNTIGWSKFIETYKNADYVTTINNLNKVIIR